MSRNKETCNRCGRKDAIEEFHFIHSDCFAICQACASEMGIKIKVIE